MTARSDILNYIMSNWTATPVYALDDLMRLEDLPATNEEIILLVDFPPASEYFAAIAVNQTNCFREDGFVQLIFALPIGFDSAQVWTYAEDLRDLVRAKRLGQTVMRTVDPFSGMGSFDGKWQLYISILNYYRDDLSLIHI